MAATLITGEQVEAARAELAKRDLKYFLLRSWHTIENQPFTPGRHIDVMAEHLTALRKREIKNLVINIPPGCCKTLLCSIIFHGWVWAGEPWKRILSVTYSDDAAKDMAIKSRTLIGSDWFSQTYPQAGINPGRDTIYEYHNQSEGWRISTATGGRGTGVHPDIAIVDDPIKGVKAESSADLESCNRYFANTLFSRGVVRDCAKLLVMQRLKPRDASWYWLQRKDVVHLCLPMEFDLNHEFVSAADWRKEPGELLWPEKFTTDTVADMRRSMELQFGLEYPEAQLQQRPVSAAGAEWPSVYFVRSKIVADRPPARTIGPRIMTLDPSKGRTEKSDYSAFVFLSLGTDGKVYIEADIERRPVEKIINDALGLYVSWRPDSFTVESNSWQDLLADNMIAAFQKAGIPAPRIDLVEHTMDKKVRIRKLGHYLKYDLLRFVRSHHTELLIQQLEDFPLGLHDDGPDALEMAITVADAMTASPLDYGIVAGTLA